MKDRQLSGARLRLSLNIAVFDLCVYFFISLSLFLSFSVFLFGSPSARCPSFAKENMIGFAFSFTSAFFTEGYQTWDVHLYVVCAVLRDDVVDQLLCHGVSQLGGPTKL